VDVPAGVSDLAMLSRWEKQCKPWMKRSEEEKSSHLSGFAAQSLGICHCKELKTSSQTHTKPLL